MGRVVHDLLIAYAAVIFVRVVLSWFPIEPGSPLLAVVRVLNALTEPVLGPLRRLLPAPRAGAMALDLSPLIAMLVLYFVASRIPT